MAFCLQVVVPTRVGQGYVFEASQPEQDEYDIPRHLLAPGPQDIYDVPPVRGLLPSQYGQEVGTGSRSWGDLGPAPLRELRFLCPDQGGPGVSAVGFLLFPSPPVALAPVSLHLFCLRSMTRHPWLSRVLMAGIHHWMCMTCPPVWRRACRCPTTTR